MSPLKPLVRPFLLPILAALGLGMNVAPAGAGGYTDNGDGTLTDSATGLTWMRCALPQTWNGSVCTGSVGAYTWSQANAASTAIRFAGADDWRLPNVRELLTLVNWSDASIAIDANAFQGLADHMNFWTSTTAAASGSGPWDVNFAAFAGADNYNQPNDGSDVRLVRGSTTALLRADRPDADYVDNGNGTVTHAASGLIWQKCLAGQTWDGNACTGSAIPYRWDDARALTSHLAGKHDWRLPTVEELLTLVDYTRTAPAINTTLFPGTPAAYFWSSTPTPSMPEEYIRVIDFGQGISGTSYFRQATEPYVRLVREVNADLFLAADCVFAWLESVYPEHLPATGAATDRLAPYYFRHYPGSGAYLGISTTDHHLYYLGPAFGGQLTDLGAFSAHHGNSGCI